MKKWIIAVFFLAYSPMFASAVVLEGNGGEERAGDTPFWWWDSASGSGLGYSDTVAMTGGRSISMECGTQSAKLFKGNNEALGTATPQEFSGGILCMTWKIPEGSISTSGMTDLFGFDNSGTLHNNGTGKGLVRATNDTLQLDGNCTSSTMAFDVDDNGNHRYCLQYTFAGGLKLWIDKDPGGLDGPDLSCTNPSGSNPDGFKITCFEGSTDVQGQRYVDDIVFGDLDGVEFTYSSRIARLQETGLYRASGAVKLGDCSANTELECVDGTYTEPGNGTNTNNAGTHAVKLDDVNDCVSYTYSLAQSVPYNAKITALLMEPYAVETNANNQVRMFYNLDQDRVFSSGCASSGDSFSASFDWNSGIRLHRWVVYTGLLSVAAEDNDSVVVGYEKTTDDGSNWRLEAPFIQAAFVDTPHIIIQEGRNLLSPKPAYADAGAGTVVVGMQKTKQSGNFRLENLITQVAYVPQ